jgi:alkyl hydroperoxide reductase subunit F
MSLEEIVAKLDTGASAREASQSRAKVAFDVLVVGGGPAGSAAAIYAARKGIRTGVAAERFGGPGAGHDEHRELHFGRETEGSEAWRALEQHVKDYDVDVMNLQTCEKLIPATETAQVATPKFNWPTAAA